MRDPRSARTPADLVRRTVAGAAAVFAVVLAAQWPFRLLSVNLVDEGLVLQLGADVLDGRRLYRDAVVFAWPGAFYLTALAFWLGGVSVEVGRTVAAGSFAAAAALVWLIVRWFTGSTGAVLGVAAFLAYRVWAYPHWQMLNYSSLAMTFVLAATWLAGQALGSPRRAWALAAGVAAAVATLCKQDSGGIAAILLAPALVAGAPRGGRLAVGLAFAGGFAAVLGAWGAHLAATGTLGVTFAESVLSPLYGARAFSGYLERPSPLPLLSQDPALRAKFFSYAPPVLIDLFWIPLVASRLYRETALVDVMLKLVYWLPWLLLAACALVVWRRWRAGEPVPLAVRRLGLLGLVTLASQLAFSPPRDWVHLVVLYPPTLLLAAALAALAVPRRGPLALLARGAAAVAVLTALGVSGGLALHLRHVHDTPLRTARGTLYGTSVQVEPLQALVDAVAGTAAPLQALPYHTLVNFLSARPNPSRYYVVWPVDPNARRDAEVIEGLARAPDAEVLYSPMQVPHYPRPVTYARPLFAYLAEHYETVRVYGGDPAGFTFLRAERRPPPPGRWLPDAARGEALVRFVEDPARTQYAEPTTGQVDLREEPWPFKRTLGISIDPSGWTEVAYPLEVRPGDRFETSLGLSPDDIGRAFMPAVEFAVLVDDGAEARTVLQRTLDPYRDPSARSWVPVSVDLDPWAGREVVLRLRTGKRAGLPGHRDVAGWGDPRIVSAR